MEKEVLVTKERASEKHYDCYLVDVKTELPDPLIVFLKRVAGVVQIHVTNRYQMRIFVGRLFDSQQVVDEVIKQYRRY